MTKFQVGDRVEVCNHHLDAHGSRGVVAEITGTDAYRIHLDGGSSIEVWSPSLRLVEPEPKPKTDKEYGPSISGFQIRFTQEPNTLGTTDSDGVGVEDLTVDCEYQLPGEEPFFVIRTTSGWSFDQPETLLALLTTVKESEKLCRSSMPQT